MSRVWVWMCGGMCWGGAGVCVCVWGVCVCLLTKLLKSEITPYSTSPFEFNSGNGKLSFLSPHNMGRKKREFSVSWIDIWYKSLWALWARHHVGTLELHAPKLIISKLSTLFGKIIYANCTTNLNMTLKLQLTTRFFLNYWSKHGKYCDEYNLWTMFKFLR